MIRRRRSAFSLIEILITIVIIAGLTLSALRRGRETAENLKIAQVVRSGVSRCAELKVQRLPNNFFHVRWKGDQNEPRSAFLRQDNNGEFSFYVGAPPPLP